MPPPRPRSTALSLCKSLSLSHFRTNGLPLSVGCLSTSGESTLPEMRCSTDEDRDLDRELDRGGRRLVLFRLRLRLSEESVFELGTSAGERLPFSLVDRGPRPRRFPSDLSLENRPCRPPALSPPSFRLSSCGGVTIQPRTSLPSRPRSSWTRPPPGIEYPAGSSKSATENSLS